MKPFGKTKDGVIDSLLRAYVSRPINPPQSCSGFDPDLANAYTERSLPPASRSRYEKHLSECGACRKNVAALVRLADASAVVSPVAGRDRANWLSGAGKVFGALSRPQWAMAATAVLVLAISLPVLLSRESNRPAKQVADSLDSNQQSASIPQPENQPTADSRVANPKVGSADTSASVAATRKREIDTLSTNSPGADRSASVTGTAAGAVTDSRRSDAKSTSPAPEDPQRKPQPQLSQAPAQSGAPSSQVAKNESDQSKSQTPTKDSGQPALEVPPGSTKETHDKEKAAKADEVAPPPPAAASSSEVSRMKGLKRPTSKLALRDSSGEAVRPNERKISRKDFWFNDNTWTDKAFDPNKNLPIVTIVYDSNVYKEEVAKRTGLKPYLTAFSETERAIIVYKGKVYKLIPQR